MRFLKGQTHAHTDRSGDGTTTPAEVARFYAEHAFDFVVFTDHNVVTALEGGPLLALPGIELTYSRRPCLAEPADGPACALHVNGLFLETAKEGDHYAPPQSAPDRESLYADEISSARNAGGLAQLNHPNFFLSADAALIARLVPKGLTLLEIANQAWDSNNEGDARHPSTDAIWDALLSEGVTVFGVATDDAHHYFDAEQRRGENKEVFGGDLGFVMVRARLEPASIKAAMASGDFYGSTGVILERLEQTADALELAVKRPAKFRFIGKGGAVLLEQEGVSARFPLAQAKGGYVRAVVEDAEGRRAFTQPIFIP